MLYLSNQKSYYLTFQCKSYIISHAEIESQQISLQSPVQPKWNKIILEEWGHGKLSGLRKRRVS